MNNYESPTNPEPNLAKVDLTKLGRFLTSLLVPFHGEVLLTQSDHFNIPDTLPASVVTKTPDV